MERGSAAVVGHYTIGGAKTQGSGAEIFKMKVKTFFSFLSAYLTRSRFTSSPSGATQAVS